MKKYNYSQNGLEHFISLTREKITEEKSRGFVSILLSKIGSLWEKENLIINNNLSKGSNGDIFLKKGDEVIILVFHNRNNKEMEKTFDELKRRFDFK